jgi:hypothetical protein
MRALDLGATFIYTAEPTVNYSLGGTSGDFIGHSNECMRVVSERFPALSQREIEGLYQCFFVFLTQNSGNQLNVLDNHTIFLRELLAKYAGNIPFVESLSWACMLKLTHPNDTRRLISLNLVGDLKHRVHCVLRPHPQLYRLIKSIYNFFKNK